MAARKNKTWKLRSKHGRDKIFENPESLLQAAGEYFDWADKNPWHRNEAVKSGESAGLIIEVPVQRPLTLKALCHFLDVDFTTWQLYKKREGFVDAVSSIKEFIYNQKLEGAICSIFNANIISRHLGLVDRQDVTSDNEALGREFFLQALKDSSVVDDTE